MLLAIIAGVVLPAFVVLGVDRHQSRQSQEPVVQAHRAAALVLAAAVFTEPAWTLSEPGLQAALARILKEPSVCAVEVLDLQPTGTPLTLAARKCPQDRAVSRAEAPVLHEGQRIARLRVDFDDTEIDRLLNDRLRSSAWLVAVQVVMGGLVLAGVLALRLLRPIDRLKRQAALLASRTAAPALEWTRRDELGELGQHLNDVGQRLHALFGELEAKNTDLHKLAMYDPLTGLPNRTLLRELFNHEAAAARRGQRALALLFLDLDRFKTVNDSLGHAAGDELLMVIAERLTKTLRDSDIVCRMGGDEFVVLLPYVGGWDQVAGTAERLLEAVSAPLTLTPARTEAQVSASIGIAMYPADGADFDSLARTADLAMYRSKDLGRSRYSFYHPELDSAFRGRLALERELQRALQGGEMVLHYQPMVDAQAGRIVGCEALLRWQHPQRGLLQPAAFVAAAEETGLIREIGLWTLAQACRQFAAWREEGLELQHVALNVSAHQAHESDLPDAVAALMQEFRLQPGQLVLELTESALMSDSEAALRTVNRLRGTGARLAIDDFGTGYSSLSYLKMLRPDMLKIDRSFVRDLPHDRDDRALTEAILGMACALGITVVAEGVEREGQRDLLCSLGCRQQQGFLFGKAVPADEFAALLQPAEA